MDNRERAKARDKERRRPISLEEKLVNFIAVVRKREMLPATKVKMSGSEKKKIEQEQMRYLLHKTCNKEVSGSFTI